MAALRAALLASLALLACTASGRTLLQDALPIMPNTTGINMGGFTFGSNVGAYTKLAQDVCDIQAALSPAVPNFAAAMDIYEVGKNAASRTALRNLKSFATGVIYGNPLPFRMNYIAYYNDLYFMDSAIEEALTLPAAMRAQVLKLTPQGSLLINYVMHEVEAGLNKTAFGVANNTDLISGAPHNLDEAWGLYAGVGTATTGGCGSIFSLVQTLAKSFGTQLDSADGTVCQSRGHNAILLAFRNMYAAARTGNLANFQSARNAFASALLLPYMQGTLKAAFEVSRKVELKQSAAVPLAQGYAYWRAIEPIVAAADSAAADVVAEAFFLDQAPAADTYAKVLAALQAVYPKVGVHPARVGTIGAKAIMVCDGSKPRLQACIAKCVGVPRKLVCGADKKTYANKCNAQCWGTTVRKAGKC